METDPAGDLPSIELPSAHSGDLSKDRILAAVCDQLLAPITSVVSVSAVSNSDDVVRVTIAVASYLGYFFLCEGLLGATPGKLLFGLRVKRLSGEPASWLQIGVRTICRIIETNPVVVGSLPACIFIIATQKHQRFGDLLAGTIVVSRSRLQSA